MDNLSDVTLNVSADQTELAAAVARQFVATVVALQKKQNTVRVVLTGGGAGIETLSKIAELDHAAQLQQESFPIERIDWNNVLVFFGDERFLPVGDAERNDTQAQKALLQHIEIPEQNIFRYPAPSEQADFNGPELDQAAADYAAILREQAPDGFDIHLLGMGPEGHINSLFPHTVELLQSTSTVVPVRDCPKPPPQRVSLSIDAVNSANHVWLLVAGEAKRQAATEVLRRGNGAQWPAALVAGRKTTVLWVDTAAQPL